MQNSTAVDGTLHLQLGLESEGFVSRLLAQLMDLVRASKRLPLGEEHSIRRGSREFLTSSKELGERSLAFVHRTLRFLDPGTHQNTAPEELANFNLMIDSLDTILERVDSSLRDAITGNAAIPELTASSANCGKHTAESSVPSESSSLAGKPQVRWRLLIDNERTEFVPRLLVKHNQQVPLDTKIVEAQCKVGLRSGSENVTLAITTGGSDASGQTVPEAMSDDLLRAHLGALGVGKPENASRLPHPYVHEIDSLSWPDEFFRIRCPQRYAQVEDTPLVLVRTERELEQMIEELKSCRGSEIAVDVEHHDYRTYRGFVCLVQVSTRQKDFIIDPFEIFESMHLLNEVFSDPQILKVLHGADMDVVWLQRDFSVYLVNMFDTGLATRALKLHGGYGLANLVQHYCGVKLDKKYQTADWRQRPLPPDYIHYARLDTHYLLYCYDCLRNVLLTQEGSVFDMRAALPEDTTKLQATEEGVRALQAVLDRTSALCKSQHVECPLDAESVADKLCVRYSSKQRPLDQRQTRLLRMLVQWRDRLARNLDESWNYIAPDACLWRVSLSMPTAASQLRGILNPVPPVVHERAQEIMDLIARSNAVAGHAQTASAAPAGTVAEDPVPQLDSSDVALSQVAAENTTVPSSVAESAALSSRATPGLNGACLVSEPWPVRRSTSAPKPVVHVTVKGAGCKPEDDVDAESAGGLRALLSGMAIALEEALAQEGSPAAHRIRTAMRFAASAPLAAVAADDLPPPSTDVLVDEAQQPVEDGPIERLDEMQLIDALAQPEASTALPADVPALSRKKRKKVGIGDSLEQLATKAATVVGSASLDSLAQLDNGDMRKKRKKKLAAQTFVDPYG